MNSAFQMLFPSLVIVILQFSQVLAEICADGSRCQVHQKCCDSDTGCCYTDDHFDDDRDNRYSYGYRLSVWNMWYFWFVVLFVLMSCFGGCGYYRQRQRVIRTQQGLGGPVGGSFLATIRRTRGHGTGTVTLEPAVGVPYAFSGPGTTPQSTVLTPPPYSEVVSHPDLFPSSKSTLPPNQPLVTPPSGEGGPLYGNQVDPDAPHLPSYAEVISMSTSTEIPSTYTANQNEAGQDQPSNHSQPSRNASANQNGVSS